MSPAAQGRILNATTVVAGVTLVASLGLLVWAMAKLW